MANPILVTGAAGRVGGVGCTVAELLLKRGTAARTRGLVDGSVGIIIGSRRAATYRDSLHSQARENHRVNADPARLSKLNLTVLHD